MTDLSPGEMYKVFTPQSLILLPFFVPFWLVACSLSPSSNHDDCKKITQIYFVDAHTQLPVEVETNVVLERMDECNVKASIISARGGRTSSSITDFSFQYPQRIIAAIKVKGIDYNSATPDYFDQLASRGNSSKWNAIGEVLIYHAAKGDLAPEVDVSLFDDRVTAALNVAVSRHWPLVIHIEFAALNVARQNALMTDLKGFLDRHVNVPIVMIHMAQLQVQQVKDLIQTHSNIYFMTSHSNPAVTDDSSQPWTNMFDDHTLKLEWLDLMLAYPSRFIFALDNVWPEHWAKSTYQNQIQYWINAIDSMPDSVAEAFAHGNAEILWGIQPLELIDMGMNKAGHE